MPWLRDLLARSTRTTGDQDREADRERDAEQRAADKIRFLREQELRRARTSVAPPQRR